jgi:excinuclease ABC subunit B
VQRAHNAAHGITPTSIVKSVQEIRFTTRVADAREDPVPRAEPLEALAAAGTSWEDASAEEREAIIARLEEEMRQAADDLDFELAAQIRDQVMDLKANRGTAAPPHGRTGRDGGGRRRGRTARR